MTDSARASLHDQRDRLVSGIAERIDVRADYRPDGTVAIMTRSGVGLLDHGVSKFGFATAGSLSATTQASLYTAQSKVGTLTLTTPSGLTIDLVQQGILQGGELAGLVTLRDKTLVEFQSQLDEIAAGLAAVFSTISRNGEPVGPIDAPEGLKVDTTGMQPGNDVLLNYSKDGVAQRVRLLNSTDGKDYTDASGQRVISVDFSDPDSAAVAAFLDGKLPGLAFTKTTNGLEVRGSTGAPGDFKVNTLVSHTTATGAAGELGLSMFTDQGQPFTNNLDTDPPQKLGFASRIAINPDLLSDNRLLVQLELGSTLGDATRPEYLLDQLNAMNFVTGGSPTVNSGKMPLNGTLGDMIGQVLNFQGTSINSTLSNRDDRQLTLDTIMDQMESDYGVNVDEEMARLMELQNAYAANARIISVVKELLDTLFAST
jgi:flagellar hook-associated protein 1 FlgK